VSSPVRHEVEKRSLENRAWRSESEEKTWETLSSYWNGSEIEGKSKTYRSGMSIDSGVALTGRALESIDCGVGSLGIDLQMRRRGQPHTI
jgi:hypothetical protein